MKERNAKTVLTVAQLVEKLEAKLLGDGSDKITGVSGIETADAEDVTFLTESKYSKSLETSKAAAILVAAEIESCPCAQLIVSNVDAALIKTLEIFAPKLTKPAPGIAPAAVVEKDAHIAAGVSIGAFVYITHGVSIGENTVIKAGCRIGENTTIGKNCRIDDNVVIYHNCTIGGNVIIQANTTIGSTGFGYAPIDGMARLIPHNGTVIIEDFVEIGANCCVDRAKYGATVIGAGTKIDNLVQIAHNAIIGKCCILAGQSGLGGSAVLGDGVVLGGSVGVADHKTIGSGTMVGARSLILSNFGPGEKIAGTPAIDFNLWLRQAGLLKRLPKMNEQLKKMQTRIEKVEASKDD